MSDAKEFEEELKAGLKGIVDDSRLEQLFEYTLRCADVFYFRQALLPGSGGRASKVDPEVRREIIAEWVQQNLKIDLGILEDTIALEKCDAGAVGDAKLDPRRLEGRFGAKARTLETRSASRLACAHAGGRSEIAPSSALRAPSPQGRRGRVFTTSPLGERSAEGRVRGVHACASQS